VKKNVLVLSLVLACALLLVLGMAAVAVAEEDTEQPAETWQVRTIATPVSGVVPSFVAADGGLIAWTGAGGGNSRMFVYDLATGLNKTIPVTLPGSYYNPSVDGSLVAFQGARTGHYDDIFIYHTESAILEQITHNVDAGDSNDWNPRMDAGRVVWEKDMVGPAAKPGIYLYDTATGTSSLLLAGTEYRDPDIWGDYVVCVRNVPASGTNASEILLYNAATQELKTIAPATKNNEHARITEGKVVWSGGDIWTASAPNPWPTYQIYLYDLAADTTFALTNNIAGNLNPSIEDDVVAWETKLPSAIMTYDCTLQTVVQVSQQGDTVHSPEVDGSRIAWYGNKGLYFASRGSEATTFPDVPAEHHYATAIEGIASLKIIEGYETSGNFGPNDLVTRQQFAKMIVLTMAISDPGRFTATLNDQFTFVDSAAIVRKAGELYPYHFVARAALTGLTTGYEDGTFRPLGNISRQQIITMLVRAGSLVLEPPDSTYRGVLSYANEAHGQNIRLAESNGLLVNIVGPAGTLESWNTTASATRAEVAQMLWNLLGKLSPAN